MCLARQLTNRTAAIAINYAVVLRVPNGEAHRYAAAAHALDLEVDRDWAWYGKRLSKTCLDIVHDHEDVFVPLDIKVRNPE